MLKIEVPIIFIFFKFLEDLHWEMSKSVQDGIVLFIVPIVPVPSISTFPNVSGISKNGGKKPQLETEKKPFGNFPGGFFGGRSDTY